MVSALHRLAERAERLLRPDRKAEKPDDEELRRRESATNSILAFTRYTKPDYETRPFHEMICRFIDRIVSGELKRGMIFAPPRHGKSEIVSRRLPAYYLGKYPDRHIIACSYSSGLASRMNRDVQRIIDGDPYKRLFPGTTLYGKNVRTVAHGSWLRNNELFEVVGHAGSYRAAGVGGGVTGMGANCFPGETLVETESGPTAIETLCRSWHTPRVLSYNHETGTTEWKRVVATRTVGPANLVRVHTQSGRTIDATPDHRFMVEGVGYRAAGDLRPGDRLVTARRVQQLREEGIQEVQGLPGVLPGGPQGDGETHLHLVRQGVREAPLRGGEGGAEGFRGRLLRAGLLQRPPRRQEPPAVCLVRGADAEEDEQVLLAVSQVGRVPVILRAAPVRGMRQPVPAEVVTHRVLFPRLRQRRPLVAHARGGKLALQEGHELRETVRGDAADRAGAGRLGVRHLSRAQPPHPDAPPVEAGRLPVALDPEHPPPEREHPRQPPGEPRPDLHVLPQEAPPRTGVWATDAVSVVERLRDPCDRVHDIQVEGNGNFFAGGVLVHNCIILDDYLKNAAEARSDTIRDSQWEWFSQDVYTRQAPGCAILIICTRWSHDDIPGRLLKLEAEEGGEHWEVLRLPAIAEKVSSHPDDHREEGEPLWPERYGLDYLARAEKQLGPRPFGALFQQRPKARDGGLFEEEWFVVQEAAPARGKLQHLVRVWDKGYASEGDPTAGVLMALTTDGFFPILDISQVQTTPRQRNQHIRNTAILDRERYGHVHTLLEQPPGAGTETTDTLIRFLAGFPVEVVLPRGAKEERAEPLSNQVEAGNVILIAGPLVKKFIAQCCEFPAGSNDDMVDAASHAMNHLVLYTPSATAPSSLDLPAPTHAPPAPRPHDRDRPEVPAAAPRQRPMIFGPGRRGR